MANNDRDGPSALEAAPEISPAEAGAEGTQQEAEKHGTRALALSAEAMDQRHLGAVLHDYSDTRSPFFAAVAVAAFQDATRTREALIDRLNAAERDKEEYRQKYHEERERRIAAENFQMGRGAYLRFKEYSFGLGGLMAGIGVTITISIRSLWLVGLVVTVVGVLLLALGAPFRHKGR